jgi:type VI secretion system protein ImpI
MPLRLQVVSAHRESMGGSYIQEFAACGGTIGRSLSCDWPLPDSKRFISSRHAMIDYQGGTYYLVDLSRNGVFINGSETAVGNGNPQRLFDGDVLRFGEFEIEIAIIEDATEAQDDGMRDSVVRAQMVQEDESVEMPLLAAEQIRDEHALDMMLAPSDESGELSALSKVDDVAVALLEDAAIKPDAPTRQPSAANAATEFLKAAGLNPDEFRGIEPQTLLNNAARLLAEYTNGMHALLVSKDKIMADLSIKATGRDGRVNPLRSAAGIENALRLLLAKNNDIHITGTQAIDAAFDEMLEHQQAFVSAMRNALGDYLGYFEPDALERYFESQKKRGGSGKKAFQDLYKDAFAGLAQPNKNKLPQRFDDEFAKAYELETTD